jgi:hypothetical protein
VKPQIVTEDTDTGPSPFVPGQIDRGIRKAVERLQACGIETFESCEGGPGHSFAEPAVRFHGGPAEGWKALAACMAVDLPVLTLRRYWDVLDHTDVSGPYWEIVFRRRL